MLVHVAGQSCLCRCTADDTKEKEAYGTSLRWSKLSMQCSRMEWARKKAARVCNTTHRTSCQLSLARKRGWETTWPATSDKWQWTDGTISINSWHGKSAFWTYRNGRGKNVCSYCCKRNVEHPFNGGGKAAGRVGVKGFVSPSWGVTEGTAGCSMQYQYKGRGPEPAKVAVQKWCATVAKGGQFQCR